MLSRKYCCLKKVKYERVSRAVWKPVFLGRPPTISISDPLFPVEFPPTPGQGGFGDSSDHTQIMRQTMYNGFCLVSLSSHSLAQ